MAIKEPSHLIKRNKNKRIIYLALALCLLVASNHCQSQEDNNNPRKELFLMKRSDLKGSYALSIGNKLLNDTLVVWKTFKPYKIEGDKIDWSINPYNDNSWRNYLHSLEMVSYLCNAFEVSGSKDYLLKAKSISIQWLNKFPEGEDFDRKKYSRYPWYDHAVANRSINLIYLLELYKRHITDDLEFIQFLKRRLWTHASWLSKTENYSKNNHGIMQDRSLIQIAVLCDFDESEEWLAIAFDRLLKRYEQDVSSEGVHLENSPGYHPMVMSLLKGIFEFLEYYDRELPEGLINIYNKMKNYLVYLSKPDLRLPMVGDTRGGTFTPNGYYKGGQIDYVSTKGKKGAPQKKVSQVYNEAGIAIFRDAWHDSTDFENTSYIFFVSGFKKKAHKHQDNLSFIWYAAGQDILIDPGTFSYTASDMQKYLRKSFAHNSISINRESYSTRGDNIGSCGIINSKTNNEYDYIAGKNTAFSHGTVYRELLFIKPNIILIFDRIESDTTISVQQVFNLSDKVKNYKKNDDRVLAKYDHSELTIKQHNAIDSVNIYYGQKNPIRGFYHIRLMS